MASDHPEVRIIAGPNGSGKTTFVRKFLPRYAAVQPFLNADLIAADLCPSAPAPAGVEAGRILLREMGRLAEQRADFAFETTLSGRTYEGLVRRLREAGYAVWLYFFWLPDVEMNLRRIAQRVRKGGHDVPEPDVRRRYHRAVANFLRAYRRLADGWVLYDNSGVWPREVAFAESGLETVRDEETFQRFLRAGEAL